MFPLPSHVHVHVYCLPPYTSKACNATGGAGAKPDPNKMPPGSEIERMLSIPSLLLGDVGNGGGTRLPSPFIILVAILDAAGMCSVGIDGRSGAHGCCRYESVNNNYSSGECAEA